MAVDSPGHLVDVAKDFLVDHFRALWLQGELSVPGFCKVKAEASIAQGVTGQGTSYEMPAFDLGHLDGDRLVFPESSVNAFAGSSTTLRFSGAPSAAEH